jgi:NAD+ kinase
MVELRSACIAAKDGSEHHAREVLKLLLELGQPAVIEKHTAEILGEEGVDLERAEADFLITIGGDGTILRALQRTTLPIFGINAGGRGFLTECDLTDFDERLRRVFRGEASIEERSKISTDLPGMPDATNEFFLRRVNKPIRFSVSIDGDLIREERGDGVMVVTPTGSTSYSLGLGGPILDLGVEAFLINFVAPFDPSTRPVVVPSSKEIELELEEWEAFLDCDGESRIRVERGSVTFKKSLVRAKFVRLGHDFYERVREKL